MYVQTNFVALEQETAENQTFQKDTRMTTDTIIFDHTIV